MVKVFASAEAKIRMMKDKITLEVEGDKKSTNPKMYAIREFVSNIGQIGGNLDRERRGEPQTSSAGELKLRWPTKRSLR